MDYLLLALVAFYAGWKISEFVLTASFTKILEELKVNEQDLEAAATRLGVEAGIIDQAQDVTDNQDKIDIKIEQHQGRYFAYLVDNDEFVAHGDTPETLLGQILERLPAGSKVVVDREQGGDIMELALSRYSESKTT
jgi:hypothetical protein